MNHITQLEKANILIEALPYIREFHGKTMVIKYGGNAMINEELKRAVINDILLMQFVGMRPVLVHGGGPDINQMLKKLQIKSEFINGLRVTDAATMEVVEMVLVGKVNKQIVNHINQAGGSAVGLCGKDGNLLIAHKEHTYITNEEGSSVYCDLGQVGEIEAVNTKLINSLLDQGYIPVISPVAVGKEGESYNVNADLVAGEIAAALQAEKLMLLTDVEGILRDYEDKTSLISEITADEVETLKADGIIAGGMIPKLDCCVKALSGGVGTTHIIDGRDPHSILLELFTPEGAGTMITK
ncbi:MAG: acetylglutamate kinase [Clostridia bacterium]|jgi:acetylglutamate kinase|nr:acetylglutamate kinase [Clostridia bacterium]MDD4572155.1 acetylglutamate kinase [Clostridia bacterium]